MKFLRIQLSQAGSFGSGGGGGGGITTINGDTGTTGASTTPTIYADNAALNCGSSVLFTGDDTSTLTMNVTDANSNTIIGQFAGNAGVVGSGSLNNVGLGSYVFHSLNAGNQNVIIGSQGTGVSLTTASQTVVIGNQAGVQITTSSGNTVIGYEALENNGGGGNNVCAGFQSLKFSSVGTVNCALGFQSGINYNGAESGNILLNSAGVAGESNVLRICDAANNTSGSPLTAAYIGGIDGVALTTATVVTEVSDQLGTAAIIGGTGITIDAASTPNEIIISLTPSSSRFKNDIAPVVSSEVMKLNPVSFNYKDNCNVSAQDKNVKHYGLIAEEVNDIMPELVTRDSNGAIQGVRYMNLIPLLLKEVQNLRKEIDDLKGK